MNVDFAAVEVRFDQDGTLLHRGPWVFSRIHGEGEHFIEGGKEYVVLKSAKTIGVHGGILVEHVVREVPRTRTKREE